MWQKVGGIVATEIDSLQIKIGAEAQKANNEIDKLINKLGVLSKSLGSVDTKGIQKLASGVNILSGAMQSFQGVKLSDFTRIAKGIQKFGPSVLLCDRKLVESWQRKLIACKLKSGRKRKRRITKSTNS